MKNQEIIYNLAIDAYGENFVEHCRLNHEEIPLFTESEWLKRGYKIIQDEECIFTAKLWMKRGNKLFKKQCYFYTIDQVEEMKEER